MKIAHVFYLLIALGGCLFIFTVLNHSGSLRDDQIGLQESLFTALSESSSQDYDFILVINDDSIEHNADTVEDNTQPQINLDQNIIAEINNDASAELVEIVSHPIAHHLENIKAEIEAQAEVDPVETYRKKNRRKRKSSLTREDNIFYQLGAYPEIKPPFVNPEYNKSLFALMREKDYCERVDRYNLKHPENVFKQINIYTDFPSTSFPRHYVFRKIANVTSNHVNKPGVSPFKVKRSYIPTNVTHFFPSTSALHHHYRVGQEFLCATQTYNHVPGQSILVSKDQIVNALNYYLAQYEYRPQCFNKNMLFPISYRLDRVPECEAFFNIIHSQEYKDKLKVYPFQYLIKISRNFHRSSGVFLLDEDLTKYLEHEYQSGAKCDSLNHPLMAQSYISNPLLLDYDNKFDFRVYMLIASTNPLMVYYHDGFLRASLNSFNKFSKEKATHMTNTHLSDKLLKEVRANDTTLHGMDADELLEYTWWSLEDLQLYLIETARIDDPDWLDNTLRPSFKKCMIHLVRMARDYLWSQSNVYALHGVDFMLDDDLNLWFIETNPSPMLGSESQEKAKIYKELLFDLFEITQGLYKSRMKRVYDIIRKMTQEKEETGSYDLEKWRPLYQEAVKNRFEPKLRPREENSYQMIIDENLPGAEAYFGLLDEECL